MLLRSLATLTAIGALAAAPAFAQSGTQWNSGGQWNSNPTSSNNQGQYSQQQYGNRGSNQFNPNPTYSYHQNQGYDYNRAGTNQGYNNLGGSNNGPMSNQQGMSTDLNGALSRQTVAEIQQRLQQDGFYRHETIDGLWGSETTQALMNFQRTRGLQPTGMLDIPTLQALNLLNGPGYAQNQGYNPQYQGQGSQRQGFNTSGNLNNQTSYMGNYQSRRFSSQGYSENQGGPYGPAGNAGSMNYGSTDMANQSGSASR